MRLCNSVLTLCVMAATMQLSACSDETPPREEPVRAVKLTAVGKTGLLDHRFVATVRQEKRAELSFETGGRLVFIEADVGDHVRQGQLLAKLDTEPARLRLAEAEARVKSAAAQLQEKQEQMRRQQAMFDDGTISPLTLNTARVALDTTQSELQALEAERGLASRELRNTEIRAPFAGSVVSRAIQPGTNVAVGQSVLQMDGFGKLQALATLPTGALPGTLAAGQVVQAYRPDDPNTPIPLKLRGVSARVESGATMLAIFDLPVREQDVHSGDVLVLAIPATTQRALTIPLTAVLPGTDNESARVFVYQPTERIVRSRTVSLGAISGSIVQVDKGLEPGEQVVSAGAAFLNDGQKVIPFSTGSALMSKEVQ